MTAKSVVAGSLGRLATSFIRMRFVAKFFVTVLVTVALVGVAGTAGYIQANGTVEQNTERQMKATATLQSNSVSSRIDEQRQQTGSIAQAETIRNGDATDIQRYFSTRGSCSPLCS